MERYNQYKNKVWELFGTVYNGNTLIAANYYKNSIF